MQILRRKEVCVCQKFKYHTSASTTYFESLMIKYHKTLLGMPLYDDVIK